MKPIYGGCILDPNVSAGLIAYDSWLWVIKRRALHDVARPDDRWGILVFRSVHCYRWRPMSTDEHVALASDLPVGWWAMELESSESDYMASSFTALPTPPRYKHFIVTEGYDRAFDVIAHELSCRTTPGPLHANLSCLVGGHDEFLR
jgi:hypothetical protein